MNKVSTFAQVQRALRAVRDPKAAVILRRFFKTGKGEYGEGDVFWGIKVPVQRRIARTFRDLPILEVETLLQSPVHEHRLTALFILVDQFQRAEEREQRAIYELYLRNTRFVNNWDLVDSSAPQIVGTYLLTRSRAVLYRFARSKNLWKKRIAILSTQTLIRNHDYRDTFAISQILLHDPHDLIHKAVGWMLREVGNRDRAVEETFLQKHARAMPRTMLRYAVEKFSPKLRVRYLAIQKISR